jgi:hypothetical protein
LIADVWIEALTRGQCDEERAGAARQALSDRRKLGEELGTSFFAVVMAQCLEDRTSSKKLWRSSMRGSCTPHGPATSCLNRKFIGSRATLLLRREPAALAEAESSYRAAIERARLQDSKSLELRAAASLARLWRDHGKCAEARDLLAPVYGWFTEGFDTADLIEAKALLDEFT